MLIFFFSESFCRCTFEINLVHFINTEKYTEHHLYKYTTIMVFAIQKFLKFCIPHIRFLIHKPTLPLGSGVEVAFIHHSLSFILSSVFKAIHFSISVSSPAVTCYIRSIKCLNVMQHPINMPFQPYKFKLSGLYTNSFILCSRCLQLNMGQLFTLFSLNLITIIINDKCFICLNHFTKINQKQCKWER